jgi:hypothetical protein
MAALRALARREILNKRTYHDYVRFQNKGVSDLLCWPTCA